jgi:hypothetical protein
VEQAIGIAEAEHTHLSLHGNAVAPNVRRTLHRIGQLVTFEDVDQPATSVTHVVAVFRDGL